MRSPSSKQSQRLLALFLGGLALLCPPLLMVVDEAAPGGVLPHAALYLFALWALIIAALAWLGGRGH